MEQKTRTYILAALIPVILVSVIAAVFCEDSLDNIMMIVTMAVCFPIAVMGLYMYLEGSGARFINGIDWKDFSEEDMRNAVSYMGKFELAGAVVLAIAMCLLISHMVIAIGALVVSVILMVAPVAKVYKGSNIPWMKQYSRNGKIGMYVAVLGIIILAMVGFGMDGSSSGTVSVTVDEDSFSVKAPMFNETFAYSDIQELGYDPDFDKGSRVAGYGTPTISSGKFRNDVFGTYRLASYTQVSPCIWFKAGGGYYAFNQSSDGSTYDAYVQLKTRTGL